MIFAVSTCLYRQRRLLRDHLAEIAAHGFTGVELFADRLHVDYHNAAVVADVQQWLAGAQLELDRAVSPGEAVVLTVQRPSGAETRPAEVRWVTRDDTRFIHGLRFRR